MKEISSTTAFTTSMGRVDGSTEYSRKPGSGRGLVRGELQRPVLRHVMKALRCDRSLSVPFGFHDLFRTPFGTYDLKHAACAERRHSHVRPSQPSAPGPGSLIGLRWFRADIGPSVTTSLALRQNFVVTWEKTPRRFPFTMLTQPLLNRDTI